MTKDNDMNIYPIKSQLHQAFRNTGRIKDILLHKEQLNTSNCSEATILQNSGTTNTLCYYISNNEEIRASRGIRNT